jgi:hypothetical protein
VEDQAWNEFAWPELSGRWQGSVETVKNDRASAKRDKSERKVEFRFLTAADFLKAKNASCDSLPADAVVMNGQLWESASKRAEYEAFVPAESGKVAYGRLSFEKMNGKEFCQFRQMGRVMGMNRLALPVVSFSEHSKVSGRALASLASDSEYSVEFLRFAPAGKAVEAQEVPVPSVKGWGSVDPIVARSERPPLMIRVSRITSREGGERGEWRGSEEQIFRLWKTQ